MKELSPNEYEALIALVDGYLLGELPAQGLDRLQAMIVENPAAAAAFIQLIEQTGVMREVFGRAAGPLAIAGDPETDDFISILGALAGSGEHGLVDLTDEMTRRDHEAKARQLPRVPEAPPAELDQYRPLVIPRAAVFLAVAAMLGLVVWLGWPNSKPTDPIDHAAHQGEMEEAVASTVAYLRGSVDAQWGGLAYDQNHRLAQGETVTLYQGLAEVVFDHGAAVIIQGPATFKPTGSNGLRLDSGRIVATVPGTAHGFTVATANGLITDYGTEFGVHVDTDGQTSAQTFTGRIGLTPIGGGEVFLAAGDAAVASRSGGVRTAAADAFAYVRAEEFEAVARAGESAYYRWLAYRYGLLRDPDMLFCLGIDAGTDGTPILTDLAFADGLQSGGIDTRLAGVSPGRFGEFSAAKLASDGDWIQARIDQELDQVTLAGWYRIDRLDHKITSLMHSRDGQRPGNFHWHITRQDDGSAMISVVQNRPRELTTWADARAVIADPRSITGRWVHLATTFNTQTGSAALYLDGQAIALGRVEDSVPINIGSFQIGNWDTAGMVNTDPFRAMRGAIDGFVVFGRALDAREIQQMYMAGHP